MTHLNAIELRLSNERARLSVAKTSAERAHRQVLVAQIERELAGELEFLGKAAGAAPAMSDDELLNALQ